MRMQLMHIEHDLLCWCHRRGGCDVRASNRKLSNCLRCRIVGPVNVKDEQERECDNMVVHATDWSESKYPRAC